MPTLKATEASLFYTVATLFCISTNCAQGFPFLHILANTVVCLFIDDRNSERCGVMSESGFNLHVSDNY